ncbi:MAG: hypothetical protein JSS61_03710 [Verrucomicrobia bacterium]|nr:hypothetical protein [Verrucomicrobiota bacterium]
MGKRLILLVFLFGCSTVQKVNTNLESSGELIQSNTCAVHSSSSEIQRNTQAVIQSTQTLSASHEAITKNTALLEAALFYMPKSPIWLFALGFALVGMLFGSCLLLYLTCRKLRDSL